MRLLLIVLVLLTASIQYPLWLGKGSWMRVHELQLQIAAQNETNEALVARNNALAAEVQDLKSGEQAVEERARGEIGMVKEDEVFVQLLAPHEKQPVISNRPGQLPRNANRQSPTANR